MRWRDDLDSFGKTPTLCGTKHGPVEANGEGLRPTVAIQWLELTD